MTCDRNSILNVLSSPLTMTGLAKTLGHNKANATLKNEVENLMKEGVVVRSQNDRGYDVYQAVEGTSTNNVYSYDASAVLDNIKASMTASAIAKSLGYAKAPKDFKDFLGSLVSTGTLAINTSERYDLYYKADSSLVAPKTESSETVSARSTNELKIPENTFGYTISASNEEGFKFSVTSPYGRTIPLEEGQRLFVINRDANYEFVVSKPEDIIAALSIWSQEKGIVHFVVKEMTKGTFITDPSTLIDNVAIFVHAEKHNKAGR